MNEAQVREAAQQARQAVRRFQKDGLVRREVFLNRLAALIEEKGSDILKENRLDVEQARRDQLGPAMLDRLLLDDKRLRALAQSLREIAAFEDPLGAFEGRRLKNGLNLQKVRTGIGVIGFIYESRPNVTIDAVALCVKSGNAVILKGGREAAHSNAILAGLARQALREAELPEGLAILLDCLDRGVVDHLVRCAGLVDLVIPRGGPALIRHVQETSLVPVIKHDAGNCHIYVHPSADMDSALKVIIDSKVSRPGVCNALESLLIDAAVLDVFLPQVLAELRRHGVECRLCPDCLRLAPAEKAASETDYDAEYLDLIISIKCVRGLDEAIAHINRHGSGHTDAIMTRELESARQFGEQVDSAVVMVNASTRFNDGGQFGLGAEIGISTSRLHARGPMGAAQLTTTKYIVTGQGQVRG